MLVLGRDADQSIVMNLPGGGQIRLVFMERRDGRRFRVGIDAPQGVEIIRGELVSQWCGRGGKAGAA